MEMREQAGPDIWLLPAGWYPAAQVNGSMKCNDGAADKGGRRRKEQQSAH